MPLLSSQDRQVVKDRLAAISHRVTVLFFTQTIGAPESVMTAKQVLDEVVTLDDRITLEEVNLILDRERAASFGIDRVPAIVLLRDNEDTRLRFVGAPAGYEFASLVEAIVLAGTGDSGLSAESRTLVAESATAALHIKVFVTPSCVYCPRVVTLAHRLAVETPHVTATCVDASEFFDLAQQYRVTGVPKTIVEGTDVEILGAVPEATFVTTVLSRTRNDEAAS